MLTHHPGRCVADIFIENSCVEAQSVQGRSSESERVASMVVKISSTARCSHRTARCTPPIGYKSWDRSSGYLVAVGGGRWLDEYTSRLHVHALNTKMFGGGDLCIPS